MSRSVLLVLLYALLCSWPPSVRASVPFWPIEPGWEWTYESEEGETAVVSVVGHRRVHDVHCVVLRMDLGSGGGLDYFVTEGPNGELYEHGWLEHQSGRSRSYDPPRRLVLGELTQEMIWSDLVEEYGGLTDEYPLATVEIHAWVLDVGQLQTPAGSFYAYAVMSQTSPGLARARPPLRSDPPPIGPYWHAEKVGLVRFLHEGVVYTLTEYHSPNSPVTRASWGEMKSRYR
jgi:hypothetical protein